MMKWKPFTKRLLSLVLAVVMIAGVIPVTSLAAETEEHDHSAETQAAAQTVEAQAAEQPAAAQPNATYTYTLIFNGNGAGATNVPANKTETVPDPEYIFSIQPDDDAVSRPGYKFLNWNTKADGSGQTCRSGLGGVKVTKDNPTVTLYAQWEVDSSVPTPPTPGDPTPPLPTVPTEYTYQLIFDDGAGDGSVSGMPKSQSSDTTTAKSYTFNIPSEKPSRPGYDFWGYYTASGKRYAQGWSITLTSDEPTVTLTARWKEHYLHEWVYTMDSDGKDGTHSATCSVTWNNGTVKCEETLVNQPHTWLGETTKYATFTETGVKKYTCSKCGATYEEEIPIVVPEPLTPSDVAKVNQGRYVWIVENWRVKADGTGDSPDFAHNPGNLQEFIYCPREGQYSITDPQYDPETDAYYCTLTIYKDTIQEWVEGFEYEWDMKADWAHSHCKQLQDFTYTLVKTHPTMGWTIDQGRSGYTYPDGGFGKAILMVHAIHYNYTGSDWQLDTEKDVMYARCRYRHTERGNDFYRCNVILYEPVAPDVQPLIDQLSDVKVLVDGVETELLPESILTTQTSVGGDETGWYTYVDIDGKMYLGQCRQFASGQSNRPSIRFKLVPGEGDDEFHGTWVLDQETVEIKTAPHHTFSIVEIIKEPTCEKGEKKYTCEVCGETKTVELPAVDEHTWTDWVVTEQGTCTKDGVEMRICQKCGQKESRTIPAVGEHTWGEWVKDDENHTRECSVCHETETGKHKWDKGVVTTAPTLTSDGLKTYTCSVCGGTKTEVMPAPVAITNEMVESNSQPGLIYVQENYAAAGKKATYVGTGGRQITSRKLMSGTYSIGDPYEEDGTFYCVVTITDIQAYLKAFQAAYTDAEYTIDTTSSTSSYRYVFEYTGYDYPNDSCPWRYSYMLNDETGRNTNHLWIIHTHHSDEMTVDTPATCTTAGSQNGVCQHSYKPGSTSSTWKCKTKFTEEIPATGHSWGEWVSDGENHTRTCPACNETETEAHKWDKGTITVAPHLDSEGEKTFTCSVCDATKTEVIPVPVPVTNEIVESDRQPGYIYVLENWKPTGAADYAGDINKVDGARQIKSRKLIPGTYEIGEPYEENGKFYCVVTITDIQAYLKAFQDMYPGITWKIDTAHSRTIYRYRLEYIGYDYPNDPCSWRYQLSMPDENGNDTSRLWISHEHYTNGEWTITKQPTCGAEGEKTAVCSHNGRTESWSSIYKCKTSMTETIPATGEHSWGEWEVTKEATCTEEGEKTRTCSVCGEIETEKLPASGEHTWGEWEVTKEATCEEDGEKTRVCSACEEKETEKVPALGHDWDEGKVTTEATCTKEGVKTFTCKNDPTHTKTEAIPMKDHSFSKWESNETEHWRKCSECGKKETGKHRDANNNGICDVCGAKVGKSDTAPKTGDPAPVKTVVTVLVISAVAICAIVLYLFWKKKKASDQ